MKSWNDLPEYMQVEEVRPYYDILNKKRGALFCKRVFDVVVGCLMMVLLSPVFLILAVAIKLESPGPVFFRQTRVTTNGRHFRIHKFRTMRNDAEKVGAQLTSKNDSRITRIGNLIRNCRLDEIAQLIDVLKGDMTFVGVRPEVVKYVDAYTPEMRATLLLPAGITNLTSIYYSDEARLLEGAEDVDKVYIEQILPGKMEWNLKGLKAFSFWGDIRLMFMTFFAMLGKNYSEGDSCSEKEDKKESALK